MTACRARAPARVGRRAAPFPGRRLHETSGMTTQRCQHRTTHCRKWRWEAKNSEVQRTTTTTAADDSVAHRRPPSRFWRRRSSASRAWETPRRTKRMRTIAMHMRAERSNGGWPMRRRTSARDATRRAAAPSLLFSDLPTALFEIRRKQRFGSAFGPGRRRAGKNCRCSALIFTKINSTLNDGPAHC